MDDKYTSHEDEITLKEVILKVREFRFEILKYWWIVAIISLFSMSFFLWQHYNSELEYRAELKFVVEGDSGGMGGMMGGLLGQFGINKNAKNNPYKIIEIARSKRISKVLLNETVDGDNLANRILELYDTEDEKTDDKTGISKSRIPSTGLSFDDPAQRRTFVKLRKVLWGTSENRSNALIGIKYNEDSGMYVINTKTKNEDLSIDLATAAYKLVKVFFEEEVFSNKAKTIEVLKTKVDSLNSLKSAKIFELARFEDRNNNTLSKNILAEATIKRGDIQAITIAYAEMLKNYELADLTLKDSKPTFMAIDLPMNPITPISSSMLMSLIKGLLMGLFLSALFIIVRKIYKDTMSS